MELKREKKLDAFPCFSSDSRRLILKVGKAGWESLAVRLSDCVVPTGDWYRSQTPSKGKVNRRAFLSPHGQPSLQSPGLSMLLTLPSSSLEREGKGRENGNENENEYLKYARAALQIQKEIYGSKPGKVQRPRQPSPSIPTHFLYKPLISSPHATLGFYRVHHALHVQMVL
jgi:hypothetical protein